MDNNDIEKIKAEYELTEEQYKEMYNKCRDITFYKCEPQEHPVAVFVGGQTGAGKGGIDVYSKQELLKKGAHAAVLDVDVFRALHPHIDEILAKHQKIYTNITADVTRRILRQMMQEAIDNKYDFIFEGTLRNTEPLETLKKMPDSYKKYIRIMATSARESLLTAFERNYQQIKVSGYGRFTNVETHNITYNGVLNTVKEAEKYGLDITFEIFKRGKDMVSPIKIFSTDESDKLASDELVKGREEDTKLFVEEREKRLQILLDTLVPKDDYEKEQLAKLKQEFAK